MANLFIDLPVPAGNGVGASVDVSVLGKVKTISVEGTGFNPAQPFQASLTVEYSVDGGVTFVALHTFTRPGKRSFELAAQFMRVRVSAFTVGAGLNCDVGSNDNGASFVGLPMPAGDGTGAPVDVSALGTWNTIVCVPGAPPYSGSILVEVSEDGVDWNECVGFQGAAKGESLDVVAQFMRVRRRNTSAVIPGTATVSVGAVNDPVTAAGAASNPVACFVFRPGGAPGSNVYTTWPTLIAAMATVAGRKCLEFDNSITSPVVIPAGGPYDMTDVVWTSIPTGSAGVTVEIADGATFTNLRKIQGFASLGLFAIRIISAATAPVSDFANLDVVVLENVLLQPIGGAAFFSGAGLPGASTVSFHLRNTNLAGGGSIIDFPVAATTIDLQLWDGTEILPDSLGVGAAAAIDISYWGSPEQIAIQTALLGTRTEFVLHQNRLDVFPDPPTAPLTANPKGNLGRNTLYRVDGTSAATYVLPLAALTRGMVIVVKDVVGGALAAVGRDGADTIDGATSVPVPPGGSVEVVSDGLSNWIVVVVPMAERYAPPEKWVRVNILAPTPPTAMSALVSTNFDNIKMIRPGSIVGLSTRLTAALTGGSITVTVTINGVAGTLSITEGIGGAGDEATQIAGIDTFVAGDLLGIEFSTTAGTAPITSDLESWLDLEFSS